MAKQKVTDEMPAQGVSVLIDPKLVLADDNTRFGLKQARIDSLAQDILAQGGVLEPVEVEPLGAEASNGHKYRLTFGNYRLAAVTKLNADGAGLQLPAIVRTTSSPVDRLKRQLAENMERENQSPMDQAVAMKRLLDAGLTKLDVRNIFSCPGGRKGAKMQPASNSFVNMTMSFLNFPKKIQNLIHDGTIGVAAAYQLTKVEPAKRDAVVERAQEEREKALAREEADDEKYLAAEKKAADERERLATLESNATQAQLALSIADVAVKEKAAAVVEAQKILVGRHKDTVAKKEAMTALKQAEANHKIAEADYDKARDAAKRCVEQFEMIQTRAAEKAGKLKEVKAAPKAAKAVSSKDIQKAASAEGSKTAGAVMLNASEMRNVVQELCATGPAANTTVTAIGIALRNCFQGITTDKQLYKELVKIVS